MRFSNGGVVLSFVAYDGRTPALAFPSWEDFALFASTVHDFYKEMEPDVPNVFKKAFNDNESL